MKKGICILFVLLLVTLCLPVGVAAEIVTQEDYLTYTLVGDTYTVTDCVESISGDLAIPAEYEGKPVTAIGERAFMECRSLTKVVIPEGVTAIGANAFGNCANLREVTIPAGVTAIGSDAFSNTNLYNDSARWEEGMLYTSTEGETVRGDGLLYIGDCLIAANPALSRAVIKDGTRLIADDAFFGCQMKDLSIPASVTVVGKRAFGQCDALTDLYYGGTADAFGKVTLGEDNEALTSANKTYEKQLEGLGPEEEKGETDGKKPVNLWKVISIVSAVVAAVTFVLGIIAYWPKKKKGEDTENAAAEKPAESKKAKSDKKAKSKKAKSKKK